MRVELARLRSNRTVDSFGMLNLPDSVGLPAVILRDGEFYVQGSLGGDVVYFQQTLYDATGKLLKKRREREFQATLEA